MAYLYGGYGQDGIPIDELVRVDFGKGGVELTLLEQENPP
jgi:hypothetical protein